MKKFCLLFFLSFFVISFSFAQKPYWWDNAHKDDDFFMYERGTATNAKTEQEALTNAILAAKEMIIERIGIYPALSKAGLSYLPEFALINCTLADSGTEKKGKIWTAWVLLKYPQEEKQKILDRWETSISSIYQLQEQEEKIPIQFELYFSSLTGQTAFKTGEEVVFIVRSEKDCYLLILDHLADGTTVLLYPNRFHPHGFIKKGQLVSIPSLGNEEFKIVVGPPFGDDRIEAIASTEKNTMYALLEEQVKKLDPQNPMLIFKRGLFIDSLTSALNETTDNTWSRAEFTLSTYE